MDYISSKLIQAQALEGEETYNNLVTEYHDELELAQSLRDEINQLETEIAELEI